MSNLIFVTGHSGAGKTTLIRGALKHFGPEKLQYMKTITTRNPRHPNEPEYVFVTKKQYQAMMKQSQTWDHSDIYGNWYGVDTEKYQNLLNTGISLILATVCDMELIDSVSKYYEADRKIYMIDTPRDEREVRLLDRDSNLSRLRVDDAKTLTNNQEVRIFTPVLNINEDIESFCKELEEVI